MIPGGALGGAPGGASGSWWPLVASVVPGGSWWVLATPGHSWRQDTISKIESNIAGESIPLMFGVLPRDNYCGFSPNIGLPIWGSDFAMVLWGG